MRFAFAILDRRVTLSVDKYAAPSVTFEDSLHPANMIPPLARYPANDFYVAEADEGARYQWIKHENDSEIKNGDTNTGVTVSGEILARAFIAKAAATDAETTSWGGVLPASLPTLDGVSLNDGDIFLIQGIEQHGGTADQNGIYQIFSDGSHSFSKFVIPILGTGMTVRVIGGGVNAGKYYWPEVTDGGAEFDDEIWAEGAVGKIHLRLAGLPGELVTAELRRIP